MKIGLIGSAPSSVGLAPYGDPSWKIWACSPGTFGVIPRSDAFFELHRWEPGVVGRPGTQKPWFSPEYVQWLKQHPLVWTTEVIPEIPGSKRLPREDLFKKYGTYFFTSSLAWMMAMAIEEILSDRERRRTLAATQAAELPDPMHDVEAIGLWGVDMAATEEYGYQRAGCQYFIQIAANLGIEIVVPPESDLLLPVTPYGVCEWDPMMIKLTERRRELEGRIAMAAQSRENIIREEAFLRGALDNNNYVMNTWVHRDGVATDLNRLFQPKET